MTDQHNSRTITPKNHITKEDITIEQVAIAASEIMARYENGELTVSDLAAWKSPLVMVGSFRLNLQLMSIVQGLVRDLDDLREQQQGLMHLLAAHGVLPVVDHEEHRPMIAADLH